ncbi:hypothetical protein AArcS_1284 [Natranaeroarchaeum sulfidigenes]|uniref:Uncharacterized protein n=1 Tax=Natranaeroarchaeum sulfidigenes TaxID=2784880 RepID=A0A897MQ86_9EURY|nr:hypothetical protein AArcS_1284 [Natranaeroarchaeum sulfidigenes]
MDETTVAEHTPTPSLHLDRAERGVGLPASLALVDVLPGVSGFSPALTHRDRPPVKHQSGAAMSYLR